MGAARRASIRVDVLTLFPAMFDGPLRESVLGRAVERGLIDVRVHDIREHASDPHRTTDDYGFGGGPGMVMKPEPIFDAVEALGPGHRRTILLSPAGRRLDQALVGELAREAWLVLICGRYEGVDERVVMGLPAEEVSIGDFVLSAGAIPALSMISRYLVELTRLPEDLPDFRPSVSVRVHVRVAEAGRERIQVFQGVVIRRQGGGLRETFTVRKISFGVGVERTFPLHSPTVSRIEIVSRGRVRRAKLYYLRELRGKRARIRERREPAAPRGGTAELDQGAEPE